MKKKKLTSLDILDGTVGSSAALSRTEMKQIMAGSGNCRIYGSNGWSSCSFSPESAAGWYNDFSDITGYCCASCGSGNFSNASPC